jgi:crotonobetainyl-CoA:carnitine CoA-transferase CaiB-like acyl-CoA transferase
MSALDGIRIIELAENVAGEYCGKLLADFGAEIIKIERPGTGSPTRAMAPIVKGESGVFAYLNTNKKSAVLDLSSPADLEKLRGLIGTALAVIDDHTEDWLEARGLTSVKFQADFPKVIFCGISNFGQGAPADLRILKSFNVWQASGWGYHTPTPQDRDKPPLKGAGRFLADYDGGLDAAIGLAAALVRQGRTGEGDYLELAVQDTLVSRCDTVTGRMVVGEMYVGDARGAYDTPFPAGAFPCVDGVVNLYLTPFHWDRMVKLLDNAPWTTDFPEKWLINGITEERNAKFHKEFAAFCATQKRDELCLKAQALDLAIVQVNDAADLQRSEQYKFRGYFQELDHPVLGKALYPTVPYKMGATPARLNDPAPSLGQHNSLLSAPKTAAQPRSQTLKHPGVWRPSRGGPLAGVRVLSMTKVWAGPYAAKLMAFLGAEVIKVESNAKIDEMRRYGGTGIDTAPIFSSLNMEVLSVQLDMKSEKGVQELRELIKRSDIVLENLRAGSLERAGLDYEGMKKVKKDIILVSLKMYGSTGPLARQMGFAPSFAALSGLNALVGYEGEPPRSINQSYGDSTAGAAMAFGALAALLHRERTGEGQYVDFSATEALSSTIGDSLLAYSLTGEVPRHDGNRHSEFAPHNCYPCKDNAWISVAVGSDQEWASLCDVLGAGDLMGDSRLSTLQGRQAHLAEMDERLSTLTKEQHAASLAGRLRQAGVPAFKSATSLDVIEDPHLWQRRMFQTVTDAFGKQRPIVGSPWHFSRARTSITRGAPLMGEHNAYVYCDLLGRSREELEALKKEGVVN